jgi:chemotaxis signal transduction protein
MNGYLLVRSSAHAFGLPLGAVVAVVDGAQTVPVPGASPCVRGITDHRGRMVTVVHLGALLLGTTLPIGPSGTVVFARCQDKPVAFEVDDADEVVRDPGLPAPAGRRLPWASGVAERDALLVPIVDLDVVGERLSSHLDAGSDER